jgi:hypothetical protein
MLKMLRVVVLLLALFGAVEAARMIYERHSSPNLSASPSDITVLEVRSANSGHRRARIYLEGANNPQDIRFEGAQLSHESQQFLHPGGESPYEFKGFVITGSGRVFYKNATIDVTEDRIMINGVDLGEFTVGPNGRFREGPPKTYR